MPVLPRALASQICDRFLAVTGGRDCAEAGARRERHERQVEVVWIVFDEQERVHGFGKDVGHIYEATTVPTNKTNVRLLLLLPA